MIPAGQLMGICFGCGRPVLTRDKFDMVVHQIRGQKTSIFYHRSCNPRADHSKD